MTACTSGAPGHDRMGRFPVEDGRRRETAGLPDPFDHGVDRGPAVPDLVDDQDALSAQERIGRELEERRVRARLALVVVELDGGDQDVADAQAVGEHPGRHQAAAGDREQEIERLVGEAFGEPGDEPGRAPPS